VLINLSIFKSFFSEIMSGMDLSPKIKLSEKS
jgi:hypothetical protein